MFIIKKILINPIEKISHILERNGYGRNLILGHIKYDQSVNENFDYEICRGAAHDGTLFLREDVIVSALDPLINKSTFGVNTITEDELKKVKDIKYIIGDIRLESEYGQKDLPAGKFPGVTDKVYIPVKCEYIF